MLITCPRCQTVFQLADEILPADISSLKMRCARCQMVFSPPAEEIVPPAGPGGGDLPVAEDLSGERSDAAEIFTSPSSGSGGDETAENESLENEDNLEEFDVQALLSDKQQESVDDSLVDTDENVEKAAEPSGENDQIGEGTTDEKDAEDIVFELADDFEDDLSWDIDADEDQQEATTVEAEGNDSQQTVMDEEGLSANEDEDRDGFASRSDIEEKATTADAVDDLQSEVVDKESPAEKVDQTPKRNRRTFLYLGLIFIVLSLAVWGGMLLWQKFSIDMEKHLSIVGLESHNYIFSPDKRVIAIRGKLYNTSPKAVGKLKIKGVIVDRQGNVLVEKFTSGGVTFSAEELQNLDEKTVEKLENPAAVVPANGGELPFMLVFYDYPPAASNYHVELVEFSVLKKGKTP